MNNQIRVEIKPSYTDCKVDIVLPVSGTEVKNFGVCMRDNGEIIITAPDELGEEWPYDEVTYDEVKENIIQKYRFVSINDSAEIRFSYVDTDLYTANISISRMGINVRDIKIKRNLKGYNYINMPSYMNNVWPYPNCQWADIRRVINHRFIKYTERLKFNPTVRDEVDLDEESLREMQCRFDGECSKRTECDVEIIYKATGEKREAVYSINSGNVNYPQKQRNNYYVNEITEIIQSEYRRQVLGEDIPPASEQIEIRFGKAGTVYTCAAYIEFPNTNYSDEEFTAAIRDIENADENRIIIKPPRKKFRNQTIFFDIIKEKYLSIKSELNFTEKTFGDYFTNDLPLWKIEAREREIKSFSFHTQTVLRLEQFSSFDKKSENESENESANKTNPSIGKRIKDIVTALNKGADNGGIGMLEINMLSWIQRLRYVTDTMLMELINSGYISRGWRNNITWDNFGQNFIKPMADLDLINITRFAEVDDKGSVLSCCEDSRIISIGETGVILLREFGTSMPNINNMDIVQQGNTVKRYLAANLWLIYWMKNYKKEIGENYEMMYVAYQKGAEKSTVAKLYASVTINGTTMVAEPVRRSEVFETDACNKEHICKIERLIGMFENLDQLYVKNDEITFEKRPVIVFVCEDDRHIRQVWDYAGELLKAHPEQTAWFTTDLRLSGDNYRGNRFFCFENDELVRADLKEWLGVDKENNGLLCAQAE